jgi:hypothetical protein
MGSWIIFSVKRDGELNSRQQNHVPIHVPPASLLVRRDPFCGLIEASSEVATLTAATPGFNRLIALHGFPLRHRFIVCRAAGRVRSSQPIVRTAAASHA